MRRLVALMLAFGAVPLGAAPAPALHTTLEVSSPSAGEVVAEAPREIRLAFGGPVEATGARMVLSGPEGARWDLEPARVPGDVRVVTAAAPFVAPGAYRLEWRVISADGHAVSGDFVFYVGEGSEASAPPPPSGVTGAGHGAGMGDEHVGSAVDASSLSVALRALADLSLLGLGGLLALTAWARPAPGPRTVRTTRALAALGPALALGYAWLWAGGLLEESATAGRRVEWLLGLTTGRALVAEVVLSALTAWALFLARRPGLASAFALLAVAAGGAAGHPAATLPLVTVPAASVHLLAAALWTGGLVLLVTERGASEYTAWARRVSAVALAAVVVVGLTGAVQAWVLIGAVPSPSGSAYERLLWAKVLGLAALIGFGWYHRSALLPRVDKPEGAGRLSTSVRRELTVAALVIVVAAVLSHVPPTP